MAEINTSTSTMRNLKDAIQAYLDASDAMEIVGTDGLKDSEELVGTSMTYAQARTRGGRAISYFEYYMGSDRSSSLTDLRPTCPHLLRWGCSCFRRYLYDGRIYR